MDKYVNTIFNMIEKNSKTVIIVSVTVVKNYNKDGKVHIWRRYVRMENQTLS